MSFTAGFDRLKRAYMRVKGQHWQTHTARAAKLARESRNLELRQEVKELCEELVELASHVKEEAVWRVINDFVEMFARLTPEIAHRLAEIETLETSEKKRLALLQLLSSPLLVQGLTEGLQYLYQQGDPEAVSGLGPHSKQSLLHQKILEEGMNRLFEGVEIAINQTKYTPVGRVVSILFNIIYYFMDLLLIRFGCEPVFSVKKEEHRAKQSIMPLKI